MTNSNTNHLTETIGHGASALARVRLRPTASNRGGIWGTLTWASGVALVLAAGWFLYALVRPLEALDGADQPVPPPKVITPERFSDFAAREAALARLTSENVFSFKRRAWSSGNPVADGTDAASSPDGSGKSDSAGATALTPEAVVPPDIRPAYDNLRLVGVFEIGGKPALMLTFAQGSDPSKSKVYRVGEEFTDPAHPSPAWKVLGIDAPKKSAVLSRGGRQVELRMFSNVPVLAAEPVKPGSDAPQPPPVVVPSTREEIIAKLREAKISEAEIALLLKELGPEPPHPDAPATGEATAQALQGMLNPSDKTKDGAATGAPPAGLEEVLKMMAQRRGVTPPANAPQPTPTPNHTEQAPTPQQK